jgi:hypothetical protein
MKTVNRIDRFSAVDESVGEAILHRPKGALKGFALRTSSGHGVAAAQRDETERIAGRVNRGLMLCKSNIGGLYTQRSRQ